MEETIVEGAGAQPRQREREGAGCRTAGVEHLHHQDAVADGQRTCAAGVAD